MLTVERPTHYVSLEPDGVVAGRDTALDAVVVDHVSKSFSESSLLRRTPGKTVHAINDVSLTVRRNEIFGILGANGSGKSTLIRMMSTLMIPDAGTITVFGFDVQRDEAEVKRRINRVSVEAAFFKKLSPSENLRYALRLYGRTGSAVRNEIGMVMERLGITAERASRPLEQLSRGMQQKVAIARAFLTSPVVLLLDEPTTGLDPRSKRDVQKFIRELRDDHDATIILCSHDMSEAEGLCDRISIIDKGRLVALDTLDGLSRTYGPETGSASPTLEDIFIHLTGRGLSDDEGDEGDEE
jgi:ABC-2 type transport system ATP-binding protein